MHVGDITSVKMREVEIRQILHIIEHTGHIGDVFGIETGEIQTSEAGVSEHPLHISNRTSVEP